MTSFSVGPVVRPNASVTKRVNLVLILGWIAFFVGFWFVMTAGADPTHRAIPLLPTPAKVISAFFEEWRAGGVYQLLVSAFLSLQAVALASVISVGALLSRHHPPLPGRRWTGSARLRFLSLTGVLVVFILLAPNGHILKLSVLTLQRGHLPDQRHDAGDRGHPYIEVRLRQDAGAQPMANPA
jgi:hypothetical protein